MHEVQQEQEQEQEQKRNERWVVPSPQVIDTRHFTEAQH